MHNSGWHIYMDVTTVAKSATRNFDKCQRDVLLNNVGVHFMALLLDRRMAQGSTSDLSRCRGDLTQSERVIRTSPGWTFRHRYKSGNCIWKVTANRRSKTVIENGILLRTYAAKSRVNITQKQIDDKKFSRDSTKRAMHETKRVAYKWQVTTKIKKTDHLSGFKD